MADVCGWAPCLRVLACVRVHLATQWRMPAAGSRRAGAAGDFLGLAGQGRAGAGSL